MLKRGFTLIELLVVIAIIGILSAIVLSALNTARIKAYDAQRGSDLKEIQKALELYASNNNGAYPISTPPLGGAATWLTQCTGLTGISAVGPTAMVPGLVASGAIGTIPNDPTMSGSSCCYLYKSDGVNYKFLVGYTGNSGQNCVGAGYTDAPLIPLLDPLRDGASSGQAAAPQNCNDSTHICSWSVYSAGASAW